jgi:hypothetical protein
LSTRARTTVKDRLCSTRLTVAVMLPSRGWSESTATASSGESQGVDGRGPARVARLTRTPPENGGPDRGRLPACELAVRDAPRDVACGGELVASEPATRAGGSGDVGAHCPLLGIVEGSLRMEGRRDSQQCHTRRPPDRKADVTAGTRLSIDTCAGRSVL